MIEAFGPSYGPFARISVHTGVPLLLGWQSHVNLRGTDYLSSSRRKQDIEKIYTTLNPYEALNILKSYGVDLIVVGTLERKAYGAQGLTKFETYDKLFPVLYKNDFITLYATSFSRYAKNRI